MIFFLLTRDLILVELYPVIGDRPGVFAGIPDDVHHVDSGVLLRSVGAEAGSGDFTIKFRRFFVKETAIINSTA